MAAFILTPLKNRLFTVWYSPYRWQTSMSIDNNFNESSIKRMEISVTKIRPCQKIMHIPYRNFVSKWSANSFPFSYYRNTMKFLEVTFSEKVSNIVWGPTVVMFDNQCYEKPICQLILFVRLLVSFPLCGNKSVI